MAAILVVDDEYLIRSVLKEVLKINKHTVVEASDGAEAIDAIDPDALPDLIFMDRQMPGLNGIDCTRQLKTLYPSLKVILLTGSFGIDDDGYLAANKHLFTDILLKPFSIEDMVSTVEYALGGKARERTSALGMGQSLTSGMIPDVFYR